MITIECNALYFIVGIISVTVLLILIGYALGRNSAEKPFITQEVADTNDKPTQYDESGYFDNDIIHPGDFTVDDGRVDTMMRG